MRSRKYVCITQYGSTVYIGIASITAIYKEISVDIKVKNMSKSNSYCMEHKVQNTGKHDFHRFATLPCCHSL